jgi:hypothetical protein
LKKYSLRVRVTSSEEETKPRIPKMTKAVAAKIPAPRPISSLPLNPDTDDLIGPDGMPSAPIMRHLLDVFMQHFGCQFPFVDQADLERKIADGTGSVFLLLSIAAIAAR